MPGVTVLPFRSNTFVSAPPVTVSRAQNLEKMAAPEEPTALASKDPQDPKDLLDGAGAPDSTKPSPSGNKTPSPTNNKDAPGSVSPTPSSSYAQVAAQSISTPQPSAFPHVYQTQVTPEPPSPVVQSGPVYDTASFFHQATGYNASYYQPSSPSLNGSVGIPPASPLFPRVTSSLEYSASLRNPTTLSPGHHYMPSPHMGPASAGGMYPGGMYVHNPASVLTDSSVDENGSWNDNRLSQTSPQITAQGLPIPFVPGMPGTRPQSSNRSYSFDENMLPPPVESHQSPNVEHQLYASNETMGVPAQTTLFAQQQSWGYGAPPPDMYGASASPLQPRPTINYAPMPGMPRHHGAPQVMHHPYGGSYFPATTPGPPIQTAGSNKGPDRANLFIFHIPNHFTNLDMYHLFCQYGNLLSVRIMVEKETGRSRGFGFVSYDTPEAAAQAISELNGFAIGNKRLKVQYKQNRGSDQSQNHDYRYPQTDPGFGGGGTPADPSGGTGWFGAPQDQTTGTETMLPPTKDPLHADVAEQQHQGPENNPGLSSLDALRQTLPQANTASPPTSASQQPIAGGVGDE